MDNNKGLPIRDIQSQVARDIICNMQAVLTDNMRYHPVPDIYTIDDIGFMRIQNMLIKLGERYNVHVIMPSGLDVGPEGGAE